MKKRTYYTKIENIIGDKVYLLDEFGEKSEKYITPFPEDLRKKGAFVAITQETTFPQEHTEVITNTYAEGKYFGPDVCQCDCHTPIGSLAGRSIFIRHQHTRCCELCPHCGQNIKQTCLEEHACTKKESNQKNAISMAISP